MADVLRTRQDAEALLNALLIMVGRIDADEATRRTAATLAFQRGYAFIGDLNARGRLVVGVVEEFGAEQALALLAASPLPKFCRHCSERRALEREVESFARTAVRALDSEPGSNEHELAVSLVLNGLADMLDHERKVA